MLDSTWVVEWLKLSARIAHEKRDEWVDLDRAIGDGDHGENLDRGFSAAYEAVQKAGDVDAAGAFKLIASTLISKVGGASGPLLGTAYLRMATTCAPQMDAKAIAGILEAAFAGIQMRGKAQEGEKTMVDTWAPAVRAAREVADKGGSEVEVLEAAAAAGENGARATLPMVATKGRASYLGDRSAGHLDPGAVSSSYLLRMAAIAAGGSVSPEGVSA